MVLMPLYQDSTFNKWVKGTILEKVLPPVLHEPLEGLACQIDVTVLWTPLRFKTKQFNSSRGQMAEMPNPCFQVLGSWFCPSHRDVELN